MRVQACHFLFLGYRESLVKPWTIKVGSFFNLFQFIGEEFGRMDDEVFEKLMANLED
jgi:hypothetical protein